MVMKHYIEAKLVWPFEYHGHGTRFTIVRYINFLSGILSVVAIAVSPLIETLSERAIYMGALVGGVMLLDSYLKRAETNALKRGFEPNKYRERPMWRAAWLLVPALMLIMGAIVAPLSALEGFCRMVTSVLGVMGLYIYSADPVPSTWVPRPKRLNW